MGMTIDNVLEILEKHKLRIPSNVFYELKADIVNFEEPTTKNDLGVDCIDRNSIKYYPGTGGYMYASKGEIDKLSSVTPQEPRWIPVSERLPEECIAVLVWCPARKNIYCAYLEENQWGIFGAYWEKVTEEIVAWMPLPKPYEPQESEET